MIPRRIEVFFYGLFMDADLLRSKGFLPTLQMPIEHEARLSMVGKSKCPLV
jgi:hypothetical protein